MRTARFSAPAGGPDDEATVTARGRTPPPAPGLLLECTQHGIGTDMQGARGITHSTGIKTHVDDHVLDLRQASAVAIVEQNTALGTEGVLA